MVKEQTVVVLSREQWWSDRDYLTSHSCPLKVKAHRSGYPPEHRQEGRCQADTDKLSRQTRRTIWGS